MKRILTIFLLFATIALPAVAQYVNVQIYTQEEGKERIPKSGVQIWTFNGRSDAERALGKYLGGSSIGRADGVLDTDQTRGQMLQLRGTYHGYLIIDDGFNFTKVMPCQDLLHTDANGQQILSYTFVTKARKSTQDELGKTKKMNVVEVSGKRTARKAKAGSGIACGRKLVYDKMVLLDRDQTSTNARWVVSPYLVLPDQNNDTVCFMPPIVYDGAAYHRTMERLMGYQRDEYDHDKNDKLGQYVIPYRYMENHTDDQVHVVGVWKDYDEKKNYRLLGHVWYEDYNTVYHEDVITIWDGKPKRPQRYLDWGAAMVDIPIEYSRYARRELLEIQNYKDYLSLDFEQGKASLNMEDSTTVAQLDAIVDRLRTITDNPESELQSVTISGYSSPEGTFATNRRLSHERSAYLSKLLSARIGGRLPHPQLKFDSNDNIITWDSVAHVLDSKDTDETRSMAASIRSITERYKNMDGQWQQIRNQSWYPYVEKNILPGLRQVIIEYAATEARIIPPDETYRRYKNGEKGYVDGSSLMPYQAYHLMNTLNENGDWEGLERVAYNAYHSSNQDMKQLAWRHTRDMSQPIITENGDTTYTLKHSDDFLRPYELAAYYLSKCLIRRGKADTKMLLPYLDDSNDGQENQKRDNSGKLREWWNDVAIAVNQIQMYCLDNDFEKATYCAANHLPDDDRFATLRVMLRAMNCEWNVPEVREAVAATSPMNAVAMYIAQDQPEYYLKADSILKYDDTIYENDARVQYLRAICRFHTECTTCDDENIRHYSSMNAYDPNAAEYGEKAADWAAPMLEAFRLNPENAEYIKTDGYFNDAYRNLVLYFWKRTQDGIPMPDICKEYDELVAKYN